VVNVNYSNTKYICLNCDQQVKESQLIEQEKRQKGLESAKRWREEYEMQDMLRRAKREDAKREARWKKEEERQKFLEKQRRLRDE